MNSINELLTELNSRLPELEWKISELSSAISSHNLPRGLFRTGFELTGAGCVKEIKADMLALSQQKNERSAHFLASRIKQKINVLVALCQIDNKKSKAAEPASFGVKMLSTRQQWIQNLETDINTLTQQQQAMVKSLEHLSHSNNVDAVLALRAELGEVERRLTLAKETLNQAIL
ncbi:primosomal replication protein PriC [uncultured Legionella sp.]|uniref:primosomal replication protein PriC n=1 Tax=uncultured Legionella sp. TaxID=210934 RepID=UPI00261784E1|nr:primosomal replication protein PriC [uncultured Legionella sp.]